MNPEKIQKFLGGLTKDQLILRIKTCQQVLDKIESDDVWKIVIKDSEGWVERLDSKWQDVYDDMKLIQMRAMKLAYAHLMELPKKYEIDLKSCQEELERRSNVETEIQKDYDLETTVED